MDAELFQQIVGVGEHIHQMRDRRALIAADIGDARLQQRLGDGENALAAKLLARAEAKLFDLGLEGAFGHVSLRRARARAAGCPSRRGS